MNLRQYYDAYQRIARDDVAQPFEGDRWRRHIPFQHFIRSRRNMRVLEVGCGRGELLRRIHGFRVGVDIGLEYLQKFRGDYERVHAAAEALPFRDDTFNVVIADSMLEHVLDLGTCMKELSRVSNGVLYALVPFKEDYLHTDDVSQERYGFRQHQRTFGDKSQVPHFDLIRSVFLVPESYPALLSKLLSMMRVLSILLTDWLALHFWHKQPRHLMLEMRPNNGGDAKP